MKEQLLDFRIEFLRSLRRYLKNTRLVIR